MNAILFGVLLASAPNAPASAAPDDLDRRCYRLMAELAENDDPRVRALGMTAAHFFLGRLDAAAPGFEPRTIAALSESERPQLLMRCSDALGAGGFDVPALGRSLEESGRSI